MERVFDITIVLEFLIVKKCITDITFSEIKGSNLRFYCKYQQ